MFRTLHICVLSLLSVVMVSVAVAFAADKKDVGAAFWKYLTERAIRESGFVPEIKDGVVVGESPKAAKLMEYIVADYKTNIGKGVESMSYSVAAGIGNEAPAIRSNQFRKGTGPIATYLMTLGPSIETSTRAVVTISYVTKKGTQYTTSALRWNDTDKVWNLGEGVGPWPIPGAKASIVQIK